MDKTTISKGLRTIDALRLSIEESSIRNGELMDYILKVNMPVIPVHGTFRYDIVKDIATVDNNQKNILGLASNIVSFADVLQTVDLKSKTLFQEQSVGQVGKRNVFNTNEFQLENGNIITEFYKFDYDHDDYDKRSPKHISGQTTLLRKVA